MGSATNSDGTINVSKLISMDGENVGDWLAKKNAAAKTGWGAVRAAKHSGELMPNIAERVRLARESMEYRPDVGGWTPSRPSRTPSPIGNLNVRQTSTSSNPFESRIFKAGRTHYEHYAVADHADELHAYSGARGIYKPKGPASIVPEHYRREAEMRALRAACTSAGNAINAPGSDVALKGGWPIDRTYGDTAQVSQPTWSIEKAVAARKDHALFARISPSI
jgi:hypothetical protein